MDKWSLFAVLLMSLGAAWFGIWNHYSILLEMNNVKQSHRKWKGDDRIFLGAALIGFVIFSVWFFMV